MSGKTIGEKLMLKPGQTLLLLNPPAGYEESLGTLPKGVTLATAASGKVDAIQVFVGSKKDLQDTLPELKDIISPVGMIWVTYPKGTSGIKTDINRDSIRTYAKTLGLETVAYLLGQQRLVGLTVKGRLSIAKFDPTSISRCVFRTTRSRAAASQIEDYL